MAKFFAFSFLLQSCSFVQAQNYGNNVPAIQKQMLAAMDTCIEYMTAALICHPPKRKLEKVKEIRILMKRRRVFRSAFG